MNEHDWADRFTHDVDHLLATAGRSDTEPVSTDYRQALDLARHLATTDFSPESQMRRPLRRRLLNHVGAREGWRRRKESPQGASFPRRRPVFTLAAALLVAILVVTLAWPGVLAAAAQEIADFVRDLRLGEHTWIRQVSPEGAIPTPAPLMTPEVELRDDKWIVRTSIGNFAGDLLPGQDVLRLDTFDEAQAAATLLSLHQPGALPAGYALRETMVTPMDWVFLFFDGPDGKIVLVQIPVYEQLVERPANQVDITVVGVGMLTDKPIEEVQLNGRPAGWIDGYGLMWEADGVSYTLGGVNLSLETTTRIAESLE
jgi:hypothetical protein